MRAAAIASLQDGDAPEAASAAVRRAADIALRTLGAPGAGTD